MQVHREIEHKYDVPPGASFPDVLRLPKVASVEPPQELSLVAVYFDTDQGDLTRAGVTLRRRAGGSDDGWHLKLPVGPGEREEIRHPLGTARSTTRVPAELRSLVQVHARGRALAPIATLRTSRTVYRLLGKSGTCLAELCDDNVTAEVRHEEGEATVSAWREWELELVEGTRKLLKAADELFLDAAAGPSASDSKLARAVQGSAPTRPALHAPKPSVKGPAASVVLAHLHEHIGKLTGQDPRVRRDHPDAVHKMRVATRRLRSALGTFEPLLLAEQANDLRGELRWLAAVLGGARDAEVMRDRLTAMVAEDRASHGSAANELTPGRSDTAAELAAELDGRYRAAHEEVLQVLDSSRYFQLLDSLDSLLDTPPWTATAEKRAGTVLPRLVHSDWRRLKKHARAAEQASDPQERDAELHEARKAAKRLRYACEALSPVFGASATRLGDAAKHLAEVLGEHQDSVVSRDLLHELAGHAAMTGDAALTLGRLHLMELQHAERARAHVDAAWEHVADKRNRRWLTR